MTQKETSPVKFSCIYIAKFTKNNYMNQILNPKYNKVKLNTHNNPKSSISVSSKQIRFMTLLVFSVFLLIFILGLVLFFISSLILGKEYDNSMMLNQKVKIK